MTKHDKTRHPDAPAREDGKDWISRHHLAAQMRARGVQWSQIADDLDINAGTARGYASIGGFDDLVAYYRERHFNAEVEEHFYAVSLEALGALRDQFTAGRQEVAALERRIAELDEEYLDAVQLGDEELESELREQISKLERRLFSRSKATTLAAGKHLDAIGFSTHRKRKAELETEKATTGAYGQTLRHEGGEKAVEVKGDPIERAGTILDTLRALGVGGGADSPDDATDQ
jgi:hypothetical protein